MYSLINLIHAFLCGASLIVGIDYLTNKQYGWFVWFLFLAIFNGIFALYIK